MYMFECLPDVVKDKILRLAIGHLDGTLCLWKRKLPYIAICHSWRETAQQIVYQDAYVVNSSSGISVDDLLCAKSHSCPIQGVDTNVDLIVRNNKVHLVKNLYINIREAEPTLSYLTKLERLLFASSCIWSNTRTLQLSIYFKRVMRATKGECAPIFEDTPSMLRGTVEFAKLIVKAMPNISEVRYSSYEEDNMATVLQNKLVNSYARQLSLLECESPVSFIASSFSNKLSYLSIAINQDSNLLLPSIDAQFLHLLRLRNVPYGFSWLEFRNSSQLKIVEFSNLEVLDLEFDDRDSGEPDMSLSILLNKLMTSANRNGTASITDKNSKKACGYGCGCGCDCEYEYDSDIDQNLSYERNINQKQAATPIIRAAFPRLKTLNIHKHPQNYKFFAKATFPALLDSMTIKRSLDTLKVCRLLRIHNIKSLAVSLDVTAEDNVEEFYHVTNYFFGSNNISQHTQLELNDLPFELNIAAIEWSNLTDLNLRHTIEYSELLALLAKLPILEKLVVSFLSCNDVPETMLDFDLTDHIESPIRPMETKISHLWFRDVAENSPEDIAAACVQHLTLFLPTLENICTFSGEEDSLADFFTVFSSCYPHLKNIEISD